jgi:hypothetical protein
MAESDAKSNWFSFVPEVHYDLIARIMPGAFTLSVAAIMYCAVGGRNIFGFRISTVSPTPSIETGLVFLVVATALSWCSGMLLAPIGSLIQDLFFRVRIFRRFCQNHKEALDRAVKCGFLDGPADGKEWTENRKLCETLLQAEKTYRELHDGLKENDPAGKVILSKAQAEAVFFETASAGLLILTLVCIVLAVSARYKQLLIPPSQSAFSWAFAFIFFLLVLSLYDQWYKADKLWTRHASFLFLYLKSNDQKSLVGDPKPLGTPPPSGS